VRELRNTVARRIALGELGELPPTGATGALGTPASPEDEADLVDGILRMNLSLIESRQRLVEEFERRYVERVLERHGGSVSKAATASGIAKRYFQRIKSRTRK
jgi:DNA-binding NtrC family response regulator